MMRKQTTASKSSVLLRTQLSPTDSLRAKVDTLNNSRGYINTDRAYILLHNINWLLNFKQKYNMPLEQEEIEFINSCITTATAYRAATHSKYEEFLPTLADGILNNTFWPKIESDASAIAEQLQDKSRELFARMKDAYVSKTPGFKEDEHVVGKSMIDFQKDFSLDALGYTDGESNAALGVSKTEQIINTAMQAIFAAKNSQAVVFSRDMHTPTAQGGSIWDSHWTAGNAKTRTRIPFNKTQIATPLDAAIVAEHPRCGHLCWGPHCQRNQHGSDYVNELPLNPDSMHIAKGTSFNDHPYGAGKIIAQYLLSIGINISSLYGWATNFCVKTTGQELMAANISIIPVRSGCAGINIPGQIPPDTDENTVLACFITPGKSDIAAFAREMKMKVLGEDDIAYRDFVTVVANEQELNAFMQSLATQQGAPSRPEMSTAL